MAENQTPVATPAKPWWKSKTIAYLVVGFLSAGFMALGITDPELPQSVDANQAIEYVKQIKAAKGNMSQVVPAILSLLTIALAAYSRLKAETQLTSSTEKAVDINNSYLKIAKTPTTVKDVGLEIPKAALINSDSALGKGATK